MIQSRIFGREIFLAILGIVPSTFDQRSYRGEIALAFGLSKPAFQNSYGEIDLVAAALTYHITTQLKIDMATAAGLVRQHWREWLEGVARAERLKPGAYTKSMCFVVAGGTGDKEKIKAKVGPCDEVMNELGGAGMVPFPIPLDVVVRLLRRWAKDLKIDLPRPLTPDPDSDSWKTWIANIEDYRQFATSRGGAAKAQAKPGKPKTRRQHRATISALLMAK